MITTLFGIPNCDTVKKARRWLEERDIAYAFHDVRADGISRDRIERWADAADWHSLLNKRSATFRQLPDKERVVQDRAAAIDAMLQHPTLIKRPVVEHGNRVLVGFSVSEWENVLC